MKSVLHQIISDMQDRYNANRDSKFECKIEIGEIIHELRELAGFAKDECSECGAIGCSMVNGQCFECVEGKGEQADIMAAQEGAYRQAKGF